MPRTRRYREKGGELPPATASKDLENAKKQLKPVSPGLGAPVRDAFGKAQGRQGGRTRRRRRRRGGANIEKQLDALDKILSPDQGYADPAKDEMIEREQEEGRPAVGKRITFSRRIWEDLFGVLREDGNDTPLLTEFKRDVEFQRRWDEIDLAAPPLNNLEFPGSLISLAQKLRDLVAKKRATLRSSTT